MNLINETLKSLIRYGLGVLFGWLIVPLISKGIIGQDIGAQWRVMLDGAAGIIAATVVTFVAPLLWAWWNKVSAKVKMLIAAQLPPETATEHEIEWQAGAIPRNEKYRIATTPGDTPTPKV